MTDSILFDVHVGSPPYSYFNGIHAKYSLFKRRLFDRIYGVSNSKRKPTMMETMIRRWFDSPPVGATYCSESTSYSDGTHIINFSAIYLTADAEIDDFLVILLHEELHSVLTTLGEVKASNALDVIINCVASSREFFDGEDYHHITYDDPNIQRMMEKSKAIVRAKIQGIC